MIFKHKKHLIGTSFIHKSQKVDLKRVSEKDTDTKHTTDTLTDWGKKAHSVLTSLVPQEKSPQDQKGTTFSQKRDQKGTNKFEKGDFRGF